MYFAQNLKHLGQKAGMSQVLLGEKLKVSQSRIGAYEAGKSRPRFEGLIEIAKIFEISLDALVYEDLQINPDDSRKIVSAEEQKTIDQLTQIIDRLTQAMLSGNDPTAGARVDHAYETIVREYPELKPLIDEHIAQSEE